MRLLISPNPDPTSEVLIKKNFRMHSSKSLLFLHFPHFCLISSRVLPSVTDQIGFKPVVCQVLLETPGDGKVNKTSIESTLRQEAPNPCVNDTWLKGGKAGASVTGLK